MAPEAMAAGGSGGRYPFPTVPDGWFSIAPSDLVGAGEAVPVTSLGREFVVMRTETGTAQVFDAHCPHLGAHLGVGGIVCGETLTCPFHGWVFDAEGRLIEVPRLDRRPPRATLPTWHTRELNDRIFVWHHASGIDPTYEITPYRTDGAWTPWNINSYRVRVGVQDLTENIIDSSHFWMVHDMEPPSDDRQIVSFDGPSMVVDQHLKVTAVDAAGFEVHSVTTTNGPGIVAVEVREAGLDMLTYITQTPIDGEITEITIHFSMRELDDPEATAAIAALNDQVTNTQFAQDIAIWENKVYRQRPILTAVDGPVHEYRRWFRQFYSSLGDT